MMFAKELFSLSAAPIVNTIFSLKWSEDNQISVITEIGAHTLELVPIPLSSKRILQINRSYLYPSDVIPTEKYIDEVNNHILSCEREQVYTLLLEAAISPKPNKANPTIPRIIDVAWSPKGLVQPNRCMLATLTSVGAVDIAVKINRQWFSIHDLSSSWSKYLEEHTSENDGDNYEMYVAKARRLQATSIAWSNSHKNGTKTFAYLAIAYRSSDLVVWKISKISDNNYNEISPAEIVCKLDLNSEVRLKILQWVSMDEYQDYLFVGYYDGRLQCIKAKEVLETGHLELKVLEEYLLESDRISVTSICLLKKRENQMDIIVTKGKCLIYLCMDEDGSLMKSLYYKTPGFQISGATPVNSKEVLTFSEDGKLTLITILSDEMQGKQLNHEIVTNRLRCLGLSGSRNKCLFATVTSPNGVYDHLVQREPSTIIFFFIDDERKDPFSILLNENVGLNLGQYWDCLEVLRMKIIDDQKYSESLFTRNDLESMSFGILRATMWINFIKQNCYKSDPHSNLNSYNSNEAKSLIFLHSAVNILLQMAEKSEWSEQEKTFMGLLKVYLEVYIGINDTSTLISKKIHQALMKISHFSTTQEVCGVCAKPICDSSLMTSLCPLGHKLPRCALTLTQITSVRFRICPICKLIFHLSVESIWDEPKCLYCDVALVYDARVSGMKYKGNMKNLSKASSALMKGMNGGENNGMDEEEGDGDI